MGLLAIKHVQACHCKFTESAQLNSLSFVQQRLAKLVERLKAIKAGLNIASNHHQSQVQWAQLAASDHGSIQRELSQAVEMPRLLKVCRQMPRI